MTPQEAWDADRRARQKAADDAGQNVTLVPEEASISPHTSVLGFKAMAVYASLIRNLHQRELAEATLGLSLPPPNLGDIAAMGGANKDTAEKYLLLLEAYNIIRRTPVIKTNDRGSVWQDGYEYTLICPADWLPADTEVNIGRAVPLPLRTLVYERDGFQCLKCRSRENLTIDHIIPVVRGGPTLEGNLQTLCRTCNSRKGAS